MAKSRKNSKVKRLLIVEDEAIVADSIRRTLIDQDFDVEICRDGTSALERVQNYDPDLIVLDILLPDRSGLDLCRAFSQRARPIPIIIVSGLNQETDKVRGLELGADDYLTKPFAPDELIARIRSVLRRAQRRTDKLVLGSVLVEFAPPKAWKEGEPLQLTQREFEILQYLAERSGQLVTREELLRTVWGYEHIPSTRLVDSLISRLRKKIQDDEGPSYLQSIYGEGYRLTPDE